MLDRLGRLAHRGDQVDLDGWTLTAAHIEGNRIATVRLQPPAEHRIGGRR